MEIKIRDLYKIIQERDMGNYSNKSFEDLNEAFSKLEKEVQEMSTAFKEKDNELKEKDKELQAKDTEIKSLNNLVDVYKHSSVQSNYGGTTYKRSYFNFGLSDKWHSLSGWIGEKKESLCDFLKENWPLYTLAGTALGGLVGASVYFNFFNYVAATGISAATSALVCATAGAVYDYIFGSGDYDAAFGLGLFGSMGGVGLGPVAYAAFNYAEKSNAIGLFDDLEGFSDLLAKGALGGVTASVVIVGACISLALFAENKK